MISYQVGCYTRWDDISEKDKFSILRTFMFIKYKEHPDGKFDKVKARLVANGINQHSHLFDLISSSTVNHASVFLLLNIASYFKCHMVTYDIKGAFLNAKFNKEEDEPIYVRIDTETTKIWIDIDPEATQFVQKDGTLIILLDKFMYGLKQLPLKFQKLLNEVL